MYAVLSYINKYSKIGFQGKNHILRCEILCFFLNSLHIKTTCNLTYLKEELAESCNVWFLQICEV